MIGALGLALIDAPDRSISLGDDVRREIVAAITAVVDPALAAPALRDAMIADVRPRVAGHEAAFAKVIPQLDDRGLQILKAPKIPIDTLHAIQHALADASTAVIGRVARTALDRAAEILARADASAAARLDQPITLKSTPREVAILRACDPRLGKTPALVGKALIEGLTELLPISWRAAEQKAVPYAATKTFAVGDLIDHPKFGVGSVVGCLAQRIDVEFADGKHTLIHVPAKR